MNLGRWQILIADEFRWYRQVYHPDYRNIFDVWFVLLGVECRRFKHSR